MKSKVREVEKLDNENKSLEQKIKSSIEDLEIKDIKHKEELVVKDDEVRKNKEEISSLQEKLKSLLDILYGCHECGLCDCECHDSVQEDCDNSLLPQCVTTGDSEQSSPPDTPLQTTPAQHPARPTPWTPPPTPPCTSCGGVDVGPCPGSVCFACLPPLKSKPEYGTSSPSGTPPGTPPQARRGRE